MDGKRTKWISGSNRADGYSMEREVTKMEVSRSLDSSNSQPRETDKKIGGMKTKVRL